MDRVPGARLFSPLTLVVVLQLPVLLLFLVASERGYATAFASQKSVSSAGALYFTATFVAFALGAAIGMRVPPPVSQRPEAVDAVRRRMRFVVYAGLVGGIAAYLTWFAIGIHHAGGIGALVSDYRTRPDYVSAVVLTTVPGVTTLIELPIAAVPLAIAYGFHRERAVRILTASIVFLILLRVVIASSRLSLYELIIPVAFLVSQRWRSRRVYAFAAALVVAVVALFMISDFLRFRGLTFETHLYRLAGYYLNSINNGFVAITHYSFATPFFVSGQILWKFPVLSHLLTYQDIFGFDPARVIDPYFDVNGVSHGYTTFTLPGQLAFDFGWLGIWIVAALGALSGVLFRRAWGDPYFTAVYAVWAVGLVEFMREDYFAQTGAAPIYLLFLVAYFVRRRGLAQHAATVSAPSVAGAR